MKKEELFAHELVPKQEVLSKEEKERLLKSLKVSPEQLPKILDTDAIVTEIGAKEGDVVKITRKSKTAGETTYYRLVMVL